MSERYARQMVLPEVGAAGQARLAAASVVVVGAGGLGCPVLQYLAGAGVGRLTIVDHDTGRGNQPSSPAALRHGRYRQAQGGGGGGRAATLQPRDRRRCRGRAPDAAERDGAGRRRRSCGRCRRQLRRHLRAERRLPGRRQAAGQRVGDRHDRLRRRLLRRRPELPRGLSRRFRRGRHLRHRGRARHRRGGAGQRAGASGAASSARAGAHRARPGDHLRCQAACLRRLRLSPTAPSPRGSCPSSRRLR